MALRFRLSTMLAVAAVIAIIVAIAPFLEMSVWDGHVDMTVAILSGERIVAVSYYCVSLKEHADAIVVHRGHPEKLLPEVATISDNEFLAFIRTSGRTNLFGCDFSYMRMPYIVVKCTQEDGDEIWQAADIPQDRSTTTMTIALKLPSSAH